MSPTEKSRLLLQRTMSALGPYRDEAILIGGMAKTFYRQVPGFRDQGIVPQATLDVDLAVPEPLLLREAVSLHARLEAHGLRPAAHRYHLAEDGVERPAAVHLEFVVPLHGPERDTPGHPQADLLASALRFIDLLQALPVTITDPDLGSLRLAHPLTYAIQKTRIGSARRHGKAERDLADAFYVLTGFHAEWASWRMVWEQLCADRHTWAQWLATTNARWWELYGTDLTPRCRTVAQIVGMDPRRVQRVMMDFLEQVCPGRPADPGRRCD
jgi:hypothetical protein